MRVAIIIVATALVSSPALASPSCMTQSEARQKYPTSHLWWRGPNRCWDATPPSRQRLAQRNRAKEARQASRDAPAAREAAEDKKPSRGSSETRWRDAMSRARPEDLAGSTTTAAASAQAEVSLAPAETAPRMNWRDRWVEIAQRMPAAARTGPADLAADASRTAPIVTPARVMLALLVRLLALGAFELVVRRPIRRPDRHLAP